jgi:hypothetical protein
MGVLHTLSSEVHVDREVHRLEAVGTSRRSEVDRRRQVFQLRRATALRSVGLVPGERTLMVVLGADLVGDDDGRIRLPGPHGVLVDALEEVAEDDGVWRAGVPVPGIESTDVDAAEDVADSGFARGPEGGDGDAITGRAVRVEGTQDPDDTVGLPREARGSG